MRKLFAPIILLLAIAGLAFAQSPGVFHFSGSSFREGTSPGITAIAAQDGLLPSITSDEAPAKPAKLSAGSGGLALLCYVQQSGGKLEAKGGYQPIAGAPIEITGTGLKLMARTDEAGYLFLALPAGQYEVKFSPFTKKIRIDKGKNTLAAIRGGKRMVD
ncbi:carboxypeptidase-like regulatory domain-containing protein [Geotalea sp. SG265]|uniref:carboxypeptidase-like regulatory domain-containing protein n=1 Tax=Geotalea sp. SG265 TaxID=2922867 RepID=UPI001FAEA607|nr:carboxypeptidase-like regulatory domain-containing protein [Geotalea sp. SG265]